MIKPEPDINFYDTNSLLIKGDELITNGTKFFISSITLRELEKISKRNTQAKHLLSLLFKSYEYSVIIHKEKNEELLRTEGIKVDTNSLKILSDAIQCNNDIRYADRVIFNTNSLYLAFIANLFLGDKMINIIQE